jgi:hypothetical protein
MQRNRNSQTTKKEGSPLFRLTTALSRKARQLAKWNCLRSVLSYFPVAFFAHKYTITSFLPPLLYGCAGDYIPSLYWDRYEGLTTSCTQNSTFGVCLSVSSSPISSSGKCHSNSPPSSEWRKFAIEDYWYYVKGEWTGIIINTVSQLWISWDKWIHLKHPSYHITFCPNADTNNIFWHLIDMPTLREAKKLAEWYYTEWLSVNHHFDTQIKTLYPLAKRLGGIADGALGQSCNRGVN